MPTDSSRDRIVVGPGSGVVFDGDRYRLSLVVTVVEDGIHRCTRFDQGAVSAIRRTVDRGVADGASMIWLRNREWLYSDLGPSVVVLETKLARVAADRSVPFVAWTGSPSPREPSERPPAAGVVYDAIVDHAPVSVVGRSRSAP